MPRESPIVKRNYSAIRCIFLYLATFPARHRKRPKHRASLSVRRREVRTDAAEAARPSLCGSTPMSAAVTSPFAGSCSA
jgi:hypothetical protein